MADIFSPSKRSEVMSRIRSKGNRSTEQRAIRLFRSQGITGWRRGSTLRGKPDFVFRHARLAVFVDGCFWHGCPKHFRLPTSNQTFWRTKIDRNQLRDKEVSRKLRSIGWQVLRIWEHDLKDKRSRSRVLPRLLKILTPRF